MIFGDQMLPKTKLLIIIKSNKKNNDNSIVNNNGLSHAAKNTITSLNSSKVLDISYHLCADNNEIYLGIKEYNPEYVIIDGLWVIAEKISELNNIYPHIKFIIRIHSDIAFIAQEGIFTEWCNKYINIPNTYVAFNSKKAYKIIKDVEYANKDKILYLPNLYKLCKENMKINKPKRNGTIRIGIFGAARILKNQLLQAYAALKFAELLDKDLELYINVNTRDPNGLSIYINIIHLIKNHASKKHNVVLIEWGNHEKFLEVLSQIDISMQVSLSETFNLVSCDALEVNTPIVTTTEMPWSNRFFKANPCNYKQILRSLFWSYKFPRLNVFLNTFSLNRYTNKSIKQWEKVFRHTLLNQKGD